MRISALFAIALLGLGSVASSARAQDAAVAKSSGVITTDDYKKVTDVDASCEAFRIENGVARVDSDVYHNFMQTCFDAQLAGSSLHAVVLGADIYATPNPDRHETLAQAIGVCRAYLEQHGYQLHIRYDSLPVGYAAYGAFDESARCLMAELPR